MHDTILNYLGTLGIGGLLAGAIIEALGLPFPGGIMVVIAGILVNQNRLNFYQALIAAILGFNLGAVVAYCLGKRIGEPFFLRYGKYLHVTQQKFNKAQEWMQHSAAAFIIFGRFVPMVSNLTPYMAGLSGLSFIRFFFYNSIFALIWATFNLSIGIFFGSNWRFFMEAFQNYIPFIAGSVLMLYLILIYIRQRKRHKI